MKLGKPCAERTANDVSSKKPRSAIAIYGFSPAGSTFFAGLKMSELTGKPKKNENVRRSGDGDGRMRRSGASNAVAKLHMPD